MAITREGKVTPSILKDFLVWHMMLIKINNRSRDYNKGEQDAITMMRSGLEKHEQTAGKYIQQQKALYHMVLSRFIKGIVVNQA